MVSGLLTRTHSPYSDSLSLWLRSHLLNGNLTLLAPATRRIILQQAHRRTYRGVNQPLRTDSRIRHCASIACKRTVSGSFHSPSGVLFTFPSRYLFTIGHQRVFSLGGWSPRIPVGFHVPGGTLDSAESRNIFTYGTVTLCGRPFQGRSINVVVSDSPDLIRAGP